MIYQILYRQFIILLNINQPTKWCNVEGKLGD